MSETVQVELMGVTETNITLFEALEESAQKKNEFSFTGKEIPGLGFYIESMGGLYENKTENMLWMIYKVDEKGEHLITKGENFGKILLIMYSND